MVWKLGKIGLSIPSPPNWKEIPAILLKFIKGKRHILSKILPAPARNEWDILFIIHYFILCNYSIYAGEEAESRPAYFSPTR